MSVVDWSKAPEDATHHSKGDYIHTCDCWFRVDGGLVTEVWSGGRHYKYLADDQQPTIRGEKTERPANWDGEGLPPVGSRVSIIGPRCTLMYGHGEEGEVIAHVETTAVVRMSYGLGCFGARNLAPIKTSEQIAAEEREEAITQLCIICGKDPQKSSMREMAAKIYDAGFRRNA